MYHYFKFIQEPSVKDVEVRIVHFDDIKSNMLYSWVGGVAKGYEQGDLPKSFNPLSSESNERDVSWLEEVSINVHSVEGAREYDARGVSYVDQYLSNGPALDVGFNHHGISVGVVVNVHVLF